MHHNIVTISIQSLSFHVTISYNIADDDEDKKSDGFDGVLLLSHRAGDDG